MPADTASARAAPNKDMHPTAKSAAFMRETWMLVQLCAWRVMHGVGRPSYFERRLAMTKKTKIAQRLLIAILSLLVLVAFWWWNPLVTAFGLYSAFWITMLIYLLYPDKPKDTLPPSEIVRTREEIDQIKLKEYELHINLYQFYLNLGLSAIVFFYLLAGGIIAYLLAHYSDATNVKIIFINIESRMLKLSLLLPILLSAVFGWVFLYGARKWRQVMLTIKNLRMHLDNEKAPDIQILYWFLLVFGNKFFIVGLLLLASLSIDLGKPSQSISSP
jgi:hypothetical protein